VTEIVYQYRVSWRRDNFHAKAEDRVRMFSSEGRARAFLEKLKGPGRPGRPDRSPLTVLRLDRRAVGEWEPAPWAPR